MRFRRLGLTLAAALALLAPAAAPAGGPVNDELLAIPDGTRSILVFTWEGDSGDTESLQTLPFEKRYPGVADLTGFREGAYRGLRLDVVVSKSATRSFLKAVEDAGLVLGICSEFGSCARAVQGECKAAGSRASTFDLSSLDHACEGACEDGTKVVHACLQRNETED